MDEFWRSLTLLLVGVVAGSVPTLLMERIRFAREKAARQDDLVRQVLVTLLEAARDVRHQARLLSEANARSTDEAQAVHRQTLENSMGRFQHAYHELSILADKETYIAVRNLNTTILRLQHLVEHGGGPEDEIVKQVRSEAQDRRRDVRDLVRRRGGLSELGDDGRSEDGRSSVW